MNIYPVIQFDILYITYIYIYININIYIYIYIIETSRNGLPNCEHDPDYQ